MSEILDEIKELATNKGILGGVVGSIGGYILAKKMNVNTMQTALMIGGGHFSGHLVVHHFF